MANLTPINYKGPITEYKPPVGNFKSFPPTGTTSPRGVANGYADIDYLIELLDGIISSTQSLYSECESRMYRYSMLIRESDTELMTAQRSVYPTTQVPNFISWEEYKYLLTVNTSNAVQYILTSYEDSIRGPLGNNSFDIAKIILIINNEAKRIKEFIDGYIGEVDDSSEQRTVELFQDWATDATNYVTRLRQATTAQNATSIPQSELDALPNQSAPQLQAMFQVKLNLVNKEIRNIFAQLGKNWDESAPIFYNTYLGPGLKFQLRVGRNLAGQFNASQTPILAREVAGAMTSLEANFEVALADQLKRNRLFNTYIGGLILNIGQRDAYVSYMSQLAQLGKMPKQVFVDTTTIEEPDEVVQATHPLDTGDTSQDMEETLVASHSQLSGLDHPDAHPQYLLTTGGEARPVTGDIYLAENVRIGGIIPAKHRHDGLDGSERIRGYDIEYDTITVANIDNANGDTSVPDELSVVSQTPSVTGAGVTNVTVQLSFEMEDTTVAGYEFEIIELS